MDDESEPDNPEFSQADALEAIHGEVAALEDQVARAEEKISSANSRLKILDRYSSKFDEKRNLVVSEALDTSRSERERIFNDKQDALVQKRSLEKRMPELKHKRTELEKLKAKEERKAEKAKEKRRLERAKRVRLNVKKRDVKLEEKSRIQKERENFWPKYTYSVTICLDSTDYSPLSSRRSSITSDADVQLLKDKDPQSTGKDGPSDAAELTRMTCDLSLSYVTGSAFWSPSYDLQLSTTASTGTLIYEASLTNTTSETWSNATITLSTSQTTFSARDDVLPTLVPWHVKLAGKYAGVSVSELLNSREEKKQQVSWEVQRQQQTVQKPRHVLFGSWSHGETAQPVKQVQENLETYRKMEKATVESKIREKLNPEEKLKNVETFTDNIDSTVVLARAKKSGFNFGNASALSSAPRSREVVRSATAGGTTREVRDWEIGSDEPGRFDNGDEQTILEAVPELDFQDSAMDETGLTTTYKLPGTKSLPPRSRATRQRIARVNFSNVVFNHTVVAKYKPVAYLKAKLRNTSQLTLPRGPAGLTLDGSFMGRTRLPRCSAGDSFFLSLGVDPDMKITYPKPEVRRSTTGFLSKEDSSIYTRTITLANTKAAMEKSASIYVLDQVPISEDERLRVDVLAPRGLSSGGVNTGSPSRDGADNKDWGKAVARLRKGGEVSWDVTLKAGKGVKLGLEYEIAAPAGDTVLEC